MKISSAALAGKKAKATRKAKIPTGKSISTIGGGASGGKIGGKTSSDVVRMAKTTTHHPWKHLITISTYLFPLQTSPNLVPYNPRSQNYVITTCLIRARIEQVFGSLLWEKNVSTWVACIYREKYGYYDDWIMRFYSI